MKKPAKKTPSFIDDISSLFGGNKGKGTKSKTAPVPSSTVVTPTIDTSKPVKPVTPKLNRPVKKSPSFIDQIYSVFQENKVKGTKSKTAPVPSSTVITPTIDTSKPVKPVTPAQKTPADVPATRGIAVPSNMQDLLPDEIALVERKKTSSLDSLKRAFHVDEDAGKIDQAGKRGAFGRSKKTRKIVPQYDPVIEGPLVEPALPEGYREIDHYWVDVGESLVLIALNEKTNQNEYLLFRTGLIGIPVRIDRAGACRPAECPDPR